MIISLKEILNTVDSEKKQNLIPYDDWKIMETDHLYDMGFRPNGSYCMGLEHPPMLVFRKPDGFHLKDGKKKKHFLFKSFEELVNFFDTYKQDLKRI